MFVWKYMVMVNLMAAACFKKSWDLSNKRLQKLWNCPKTPEVNIPQVSTGLLVMADCLQAKTGGASPLCLTHDCIKFMLLCK